MSAVTLTITDNKGDVLKALHDQLPVALEELGLVAEGYAKRLCPVGTPESTGKRGYIGGTLRNSISHDTDGTSAYIGTNVEYAPYQEMGTSRMRAANDGKGFIRPAIVDNVGVYKQIVLNHLTD